LISFSDLSSLLEFGPGLELEPTRSFLVVGLDLSGLMNGAEAQRHASVYNDTDRTTTIILRGPGRTPNNQAAHTVAPRDPVRQAGCGLLAARAQRPLGPPPSAPPYLVGSARLGELL